MEKYLITLFFIGVILFIIGYYENKQQNIPTKIEYKFIDKTHYLKKETGIISQILHRAIHLL